MDFAAHTHTPTHTHTHVNLHVRLKLPGEMHFRKKEKKTLSTYFFLFSF